MSEERKRIKRDAEFQREIRHPLDLLNHLNDREMLSHVLLMADTVINRWKADYNRVVGQMQHEIDELQEKLNERAD